MFYNASHSRRQAVDTLVDGLKRLEYRGYDSAGLCVDATNPNEVDIIRSHGNIAKLREAVDATQGVEWDRNLSTHVGIAHTRWATHGVPCVENAHPHKSDEAGQFVVVHNGIITNYKQLKEMLIRHGMTFYSETDTEVVAKLALYVFNLLKATQAPSFRQVGMEVMRQLQGAYAIIFKSPVHFPNEVVAIKIGSPLLLGIKSESDAGRYVNVAEEAVVSPASPHGTARAPRLSATTGPGHVVRAEVPMMEVHPEAPVSPTSDGANNDGMSRSESMNSITRLNRSMSINAVYPPTETMEYFLSSDAAAVIEHTRRVIYLEDNDLLYVTNGGFQIYHFDPEEEKLHHQPLDRDITTLEMELNDIMKGKYDHFMAKEIFDQVSSVQDTMRGRVNFETGQIRLGGIEKYARAIRMSRRLVICACGTSYNSAIATRSILEEMTGLPVQLELASDFLDRKSPIFRDDTCIFVSQSGETADTLKSLELCDEAGALLLGITNTVGSAIARKTHCGIHVNAGPEIGVASTKAYTSQIVAFVLLALYLGQDSKALEPRRQEIIRDLKSLPDKIQEVLDRDDEIRDLSAELKDKRSLLLMGRGWNNATCVEGALKIKEISYLHSEGINAGELKHGPLALVDEEMPLIIVATRAEGTDALIENAVNQVKSRSGTPIIMCYKHDLGLAEGARALVVPEICNALQCVVNIVPLQLISYHLAVIRGHNVDQPRNLAKSVTVQ